MCFKVTCKDEVLSSLSEKDQMLPLGLPVSLPWISCQMCSSSAFLVEKDAAYAQAELSIRQLINQTENTISTDADRQNSHRRFPLL